MRINKKGGNHMLPLKSGGSGSGPGGDLSSSVSKSVQQGPFVATKQPKGGKGPVEKTPNPYDVQIKKLNDAIKESQLFIQMALNRYFNNRNNSNWSNYEKENNLHLENISKLSKEIIGLQKQQKREGAVKEALKKPIAIEGIFDIVQGYDNQ